MSPTLGLDEKVIIVGPDGEEATVTSGALVVTSVGGGGLESAVTIADGADVTQGAIADAAVAAGAAGTVSAKLRTVTTLLNGGLPAALGAAGGLKVDGTVASGSADSGQPVKIGGKYNSTLPTFTDGQRGDLQITSRGALQVTLVDNNGSAGASVASSLADGSSNSPGAVRSVAYPLVYNGSTWDRMRSDGTTGGQGVGGTVASGAADSGNPVSVGGLISVAAEQNLTTGQRGKLALNPQGSVYIAAGGSGAGGDGRGTLCGVGIITSTSLTNTANPLSTGPSLFNGATWDRARPNVEATVLASAARTATTNGSDTTNYNGRGVILVLNVTANPGAAETLSLKIQGKDSISGNYYDVADAGVLFTAANGTKQLVCYPGSIDADYATGNTAKTVVLPRTWRAVVTHSASGSWTYSLSSVVIV